jgi:propionyl-CoA carboxylase alpha chain
LIANRGEIACRVIRSAKWMGIKTVAVYSEADAGALHVREADEAILIGPAAAADSYLKIETILDAVRRSGAEAVHPGYGFLSENARFAKALEDAGVVFIGPPAAAIAAMGDKIESKKIAERAGVTVIPSHAEAIVDAKRAMAAARALGYPVMIKAAAGGGGKGMRLARSKADLKEGVQSAINEATASFGDGRVFVEKFIEEPRHIEIQVLADGHGNVIHLGERECSIQRRHQKVIEEAPSPLLDEATRAAMAAQAVALTKAVGYRSAGTVEFIADQQKNFYFLEMNTRLQVEHPVTELVTGIDLVEQQIRIAAGETLAIAQEAVRRDGWAMECRIYAEDPSRGFLPSVGRIIRYRAPATSADVRVDTGIEDGSEISVYYDPMIAKLVTHGPDRAAAIAHMQDALDAYYIRGISHNIGLLNAVVGHPRFREGRLSTEFLAEEYGDGFRSAALTADMLAVIVPVAATIHHRMSARKRRITGRMPGLAGATATEWIVSVGEVNHPVSLSDLGDGLAVTYAKRTIMVRTDWSPVQHLFKGTIDGQPVVLQVDRSGVAFTLWHRGVEAAIAVRTPRAAELAARMPKKSAADMSRYLLSDVRAGQALAVVDAMKMENVLRAERNGRVAKIRAAIGDSLAVDQVIMEFE